jgi:hypothetical protein
MTGVPVKAIFSVSDSIYNKKLSSQCNLTVQIEQVQDQIHLLCNTENDRLIFSSHNCRIWHKQIVDIVFTSFQFSLFMSISHTDTSIKSSGVKLQ